MDITSKPFYGTGVLRACLCLVFLASGGQALAQRNIGAAISIEREVTGALAGRTHSLNTGSGVSSNENIRTANESAAQLRFLDQTKLSIGPSASVVLDRFVYNPDRTARDEVVEVTAGAARWVSGVSRAGAEHLRTPHATMGVRGTMFDLLVEARRTIVILREGVIVVCPIRAPQRCVTLNTPGQTVIVTVTTVEGPSLTGPSETRFADLCLRPIDRAACSFTTTAQLAPNLLEGGPSPSTSGSTNAATSSGNVLHFATTPAGVANGQTVRDITTPSVIPAGTTVTTFTGTTVTISNPVTGGGVRNGDVIPFRGERPIPAPALIITGIITGLPLPCIFWLCRPAPVSPIRPPVTPN